MANLSAPARRYLILLKNTASTVADLPTSAWMLVETCQSESEARARYYAMRSFLEKHDAPCVVLESVKPVLGREELRILISRSADLEKGRIPDPIRLSRDQANALASQVEDHRRQGLAGIGALRVPARHAAAWATAFVAFVLTMVGGTTYVVWPAAPAGSTAVASANSQAADPSGSLIVLPEGKTIDRFIMFRLLPDGTRTAERRITRAEYQEMQAAGGRTFRGKEPAAASRTSSLADHTSMFARIRSDN